MANKSPASPQTTSGLDSLGFATYTNTPAGTVHVRAGASTVSVGNPSVASGSSSTPQMLSNVGRGNAISVYQGLGFPGQRQRSVSAPYQMSNGYPVGRAPHPCYSSGGILQGQKPMPSPGAGPSFQKLQPTAISAKPNFKFGTDREK